VVAIDADGLFEVFEGLDNIAVGKIKHANVVFNKLRLFVVINGKTNLQRILNLALLLQDIRRHDKYLQRHGLPLQNTIGQRQRLLDRILSQ
jgi:hypothetical protein